MRNRWLSALIKTLIVLLVAHIIFLLFGFFIRTDIGIFNLPMVWAHWTDNWRDVWFGLIGTAILYFVIYGLFTKGSPDQIEG
ncbi:MAG: hypothetical protein GX567_04245 [Clostridia bacterium]|nr:hypothetical protein [Clostridia bacterium]